MEDTRGYLVFSSTLGLCPKSLPVKYLYFSKRSLEDKADILATSLPNHTELDLL